MIGGRTHNSYNSNIAGGKPVNYLSQNDLILINQGIHPKTGYSIINQGALQEAATAPGRIMYGNEVSRYLGQKSAALVYPIAQSHAFQDANKRTAYNALRQFLANNGYQIINGREQFVQDLIGQCADDFPITIVVLGGRLQMQFIKQGGWFI